MAQGGHLRRSLLFAVGWCLFACSMCFLHFQSPNSSRLPRVAMRSGSSEKDMTPVVTHFGINCLSLEIANQRLLIDPLLVGKLVFWGQNWAFRGSPRSSFVPPAPEEVGKSFDFLVLSQGLDDHCHRPTLERIDRKMPMIANPSAAKVAEKLGFRPSVLRPGESMMLGQLRITARAGSVVGPPWQDAENGYVFTDTRPGGLSIGIEPHGNFLGPALGTSFKEFPESHPTQRVDAMILPLTSQVIAGYKLVNGVQEAAETLEAFDHVPRFLLPLHNAEIDASGVLAEQLQEEGSVESFAALQRERPKLREVRLLDLKPGQPVRVE